MIRLSLLALAAVIVVTACSPADDTANEPLATPPPSQQSTIPTDVSAASGATGASSASGAPAEPGPECFEIELVGGTAVVPVPDIDEPPPRSWFADPAFGTCVVRVTDRAADAGEPATGLAPEYSRVAAFNADGSLLMIRDTDDAWLAYDATTLEPVVRLVLAAEPRWDPADPGRIVHVDGTRMLSRDVTTGADVLIHDFAADFPGVTLEAVWTRWEGRPSDNGRFWGLLAQGEGWEPAAFVMYDRAEDRVTVRDLSGFPGVADGIDHVTVSPSGSYFLASFDRACEQGTLGSDDAPCGLMVYGTDLHGGRGLTRVIGHYDTALDAAGREVVVYQDIDTDDIAVVDLESGETTPLWSIDFSHTAIGFQFSGLGINVPGWAVVSTHDDDPVSYTWMDDQVFVVELAPGGRVVRLAHTHSVVDDERPEDYWAEPHASTNPDLIRIVFGTNWGRTGTGGVETYLITLPDDWMRRIDAP